QVVTENREERDCCSVCRGRSSQNEGIHRPKTPLEGISLPTGTTQLGNISGRWIFVPNLEEISSMQNAVAETTVCALKIMNLYQI
ncbi:hypothetical protein AVEN_133556-1, partial [Araneus ventricosus]